MSGTGGMDWENLGQDALRMAHSLFAPASMLTCLPPLDGLLTDPAERLNDLLAPITPFLPKTAASSPQPPESAVDSRRDTPPVRQRTRQARGDAAPIEAPGIAGQDDIRGETSPATRPALRSAQNAFNAFSPSATTAAFPVPEFAPTLPMQMDASESGKSRHTTRTTQSENHAVPDALDALRALTTSAWTATTLPATGRRSDSHKLQTPTVSAPAVSQPSAPGASAALPFPPVHKSDGAGEAENDLRRRTRLPFLPPAPSLNAASPFRLRQESADQDGTAQDTGRASKQAAPPDTNGQAIQETAPVRLLRGASPLAAMLQAHVQPPPLDAASVPALFPVPDRLALKAEVPFGAAWSAPVTPHRAPPVQELAPTPQDTPNPASPPAAPADMDALIQALEAHLELEFLRAYGTSGR